MAKRSTLIWCLSLLLCLAMLFTSCSNHNPDDPTDQQTTPEATEKPDATLEDKAIDYQGIIKEWNKYIVYNEPESENLTRVQQMVSVNDSDYFYSNQYGKLLYVETYEDWETFDGIQRTYNYLLYSVEKGIVRSATYSYLLGETPEYTYSYDFITDLYGRYIGVACETKTIYGVDETEYVYSFYDSNKNPLPTGLTEEPEPYASILENNDSSFIIEDKYYVCREGEIIYTFKLGEERMLPHVDFEYAGYQYDMSDEFICVYNSTYDLLVKYEIPEAAINNPYYPNGTSVTAILPNGNVLLQWIVQASEAEGCDFESLDGRRYYYNQIVIDAAAGKTYDLAMKAPAVNKEEQPKDVQYYIAGVLSDSVLSESTIGMKNDDECLVAAYRIEDGKVSDQVEFLITDSSLAIKTVLPAFWINQGERLRFADASHLIVSTVVEREAMGYYEEELVYYAVNFATNQVALYMNKGEYVNVNGGFAVYDNGNLDKLYSNDFKELLDLDGNATLDGDVIRYHKENADGELELLIAYIQNGSLVVKKLATGSSAYVADRTDAYYLVNLDTDGDGVNDSNVLYDHYGKQLLSADSITVTPQADGYLAHCQDTDNLYETNNSYYVLK